MPHIGSDAPQAFGRQFQTVILRVIFRHTPKILGIGGQQRFCLLFYLAGHLRKYVIYPAVGQVMHLS